MCLCLWWREKKRNTSICVWLWRSGVDVSLGVCFNITKLLIIWKVLVWRVLSLPSTHFFYYIYLLCKHVLSFTNKKPNPFFGVWFSWVPFISIFPPSRYPKNENANWIVGSVQLVSGCSLYPLFRLLFKAIQWIKIMLNFMVLLLSHKFWGPKSQVHLYASCHSFPTLSRTNMKPRSGLLFDSGPCLLLCLGVGWISFFAKLPDFLPHEHTQQRDLSLLLPRLPFAEALQIPKLTLPRLLLRSKQNTLVHKILIMYNINDTGERKTQTEKKQNQWLQVRDRPDISIKNENKGHWWGCK